MKNNDEENEGRKSFINTEVSNSIIEADESLNLSATRLELLQGYSSFFIKLTKSLESGNQAEKNLYFNKYMKYHFFFVPVMAFFMFFDVPLIGFSMATVSLVKQNMTNTELNSLLIENPTFSQLMYKKWLIVTLPFKYGRDMYKSIKRITGK